jgi:hypothetical protein
LGARWRRQSVNGDRAAITCPKVSGGWKNRAQPPVKNQVKVGAPAPALVERLDQDCSVRFNDRSAFADRSFGSWAAGQSMIVALEICQFFVDLSIFRSICIKRTRKKKIQILDHKYLSISFVVC